MADGRIDAFDDAGDLVTERRPVSGLALRGGKIGAADSAGIDADQRLACWWTVREFDVAEFCVPGRFEKGAAGDHGRIIDGNRRLFQSRFTPHPIPAVCDLLLFLMKAYWRSQFHLTGRTSMAFWPFPPRCPIDAAARKWLDERM